VVPQTKVSRVTILVFTNKAFESVATIKNAFWQFSLLKCLSYQPNTTDSSSDRVAMFTVGQTASITDFSSSLYRWQYV